MGTGCKANLSAMRDGRGIIHAPEALLTDVSGDRRVGTGSDWFPEVFDRGVFVDKSMLVRDVIMGYQVTLFCRPRRFGKTLGATMLRDFFECAPCADPKARERFERLSIWDADGGRWRNHQGRYPVVMLSLKEAVGDTWDELRAALANLVAAEYTRHGYLLGDGGDGREALGPYERAQSDRIAAGRPERADLPSSLRLLTGLLERAHGEKCVVVIDEYDAPITCAYESGFYHEAVDFMRTWLSGAFKTNPALAFGVLTGVQRVSKESIFSGLNNIDVNTPLNQSSDERFGFTQGEVEALACYTGNEDSLPELRSWYDGYRFGSADIYNPWSVLAFFQKGCVAQPYWVNTSGNSVLGQAMRGEGAVAERLFSLLEPGATVTQRIDPNISYGEIGTKPSAIWSVLYMSGYLTTDDTRFAEDALQLRRLRVPNREVRTVFRREVIERAEAAAGGFDRLDGLHRALVAGDEDGLGRELGRIARDSASYYDLTSETACHMLLLGLLFGVPGYEDPVSNREAGYGRFDIRLLPRSRSGATETASALRPVVVEVKFMAPAEYNRLEGQGPEALAALAQKAVDQIDAKAYGGVATGGDAELGCLRWGVAFAGKQVAAACRF